MSKPYDAAAKELLETDPAAWAALLGAARPPELVSIIDSDLSTITAAADKVIRVADDVPWLLHIGDAYRFFVAKTEAKQLRDQNTGGMALRAYLHTRDYGIGLVKRVYNLRYKI